MKKLFAAAVLMSAALMLAGAHDPVDARHGGGHGHGRGGSPGHFRGGGHHFAVHRVRHARFAVRRRHVRLRRVHHRRFVAARYYYYGRRHCRWLRYRAIVTGSRYWWWRYWRCVHGHPYY
jgi:hypothetical protein